MMDTALMQPISGLQIFCDNQGTLSLSKNEYQNERTKHIDVKLNFIKENVANKAVQLSYISTNKMTADILTNVLAPGKHSIHANKMGLKSDDD